LFKQFEPAADRVVVQQQRSSDFLTAPTVVLARANPTAPFRTSTKPSGPGPRKTSQRRFRQRRCRHRQVPVHPACMGLSLSRASRHFLSCFVVPFFCSTRAASILPSRPHISIAGARSGGQGLDNIWKPLLFAWTKADVSILLTSYLRPENRIRRPTKASERRIDTGEAQRHRDGRDGGCVACGKPSEGWIGAHLSRQTFLITRVQCFAIFTFVSLGRP
jgi:hypothetical protein